MEKVVKPKPLVNRPARSRPAVHGLAGKSKLTDDKEAALKDIQKERVTEPRPGLGQPQGGGKWLIWGVHKTELVLIQACPSAQGVKQG